MSKLPQEIVENVRRTWNKASESLGIRVITPYLVQTGSKSAECLVFLPDFGGPKGMVIGINSPPDFEADHALVECATEAGLAWSFINVEIYRRYDEAVFKEALMDWGFFGPSQVRPTWITQQPSTEH